MKFVTEKLMPASARPGGLRLRDFTRRAAPAIRSERIAKERGPKVKLHNYFRSSTSTRVRVALNLKGLTAEYKALALLKDEHKAPDYLSANPQGLVPALELGDGQVLTQSLAIIEWLDETYPNPPLMPATATARARVRALAYTIGCEIHPVNNLRVLTHVKKTFGADDAAVKAWFSHWVHTTFEPLEAMLLNSADTGLFCHGDTPGMADICLFAQVLNNQRFDVDMTRYPVITRIFEACETQDAFRRAAPANQPDAV